MNLFPDVFAIALFFISIFGLLTSRNIIKSIIFILVMQTAVIMFWIFLSSRFGDIPPIINDPALLNDMTAIADPFPQALMLTAIIIGISVTAICITMLNTLFRRHKTIEWKSLAQCAREEAIQRNTEI
jgi:multicomponent Na+:H+ antiporter subunit C